MTDAAFLLYTLRVRKKLSLYVFLLVALALSFNVATAHAQEITPSPTPAPTPTIVKYDLAYPGMLPDNFFYKLKVLRDKITYALISDPLKKIDYLLLQTDKGILATAMLIDKNKISLAETTALKAENNYTLLTFELKSLSKKPDNKLFNKLKTASLKHQEVLQSLIKRVRSDNQKVFQQVINFSKTNYQTVEKYKNSELE